MRREDPGPDDAFVSFVKRTFVWARANSRTLAIAGGVAAILVVGGFYFTSASRQAEAEAADRFNQLQASMAQDNPQLAIRDLQGYLESYGHTEAAGQARLLLAEILIVQDRADEAVDVIDDISGDLDGPFGLAAARVHAAALESTGETDEAVGLYRRIADNARFPFQSREALADAARLRLQNGEPGRAADLYEEVLDTFGDQDPGRAYYEMWLAEARAQAETGPGTSPTTTGDTGEGETPEADSTNAMNGS